MKKIGVFLSVLICVNSFSQTLVGLIPPETATHTAVENGDWFNPDIWDTGTIPTDAAIVVIPSDIAVTYEGTSSAHIFAIRVDGEFRCIQEDPLTTSSLTFDTFIGTGGSKVLFKAEEGEGNIEVIIAPFDIEAHKAGTSGYPLDWNDDAVAHYSDGAITYEVTYEVGPDKRFNTYEDALEGDTEVTETSRELTEDGPGVLGRHGWDSTQLSLGIITMGEIEIFGREKLNMVKLSADALKDQPEVELVSEPIGWEVGDEVIITRGGNQGALSNGEDLAVIADISGTTLTMEEDLSYNHEGRSEDTLHCYIGNLTRSIVFKSEVSDTIHQRGHFMAMHNPENVQVRNAVFLDMGRTDKSRLLDDFIWEHWLEPKVFTSKISPLGQECAESKRNPKQDITNMRGRYSIHLHKTGAHDGVEMVYVTGNVVRGNPGWGITHHDSHATVSNNVVYDVTGTAIVSESGSETGFWDNNLVVWVKDGHDLSPYNAALFHEDYLYEGIGLGMKGRAVICRGNVVANARRGISVMNMNPNITNQDRVDPLAIADRSDVEFNQFPLDINGYSIEEDGVMPVEIALIVEDMTVIGCNLGLRSIERDMGMNHESRSIFEGFVAWGVNQGLSITYQADYSFKDVFISGKNMSSVGTFLWKHSHNHVFDNIKMVDLGYGVTVSKLVINGSGELKTRNNGFTPWYFIDLELDNVTQFYEILKEDPEELPEYVYDEHTDNPIHLSSEELHPRELSFTILDSTELYVDYASDDFQFALDGFIADELGTYDLGIKQAWAQGNLRLDYPERLYEFASADKFEEYLTENGVYKDTTDDDQLYFILNEWLPDRRTFEYKKFPVRIKILNAPEIPLFESALIESPYAFYPQNQVVSRLANVSQSSTNMSVVYDTASIAVPAERAIDGNNNGRIIAQYYQQWLVPVGSFSETNVEEEPWYDLDLGELKEIAYIDIWNTVELNGADIEIPSPHFTDFYVLISDTAFGDLSLADAIDLSDYSYLNDTPPGRKFSLNDLEVPGRYVRIQAMGTNKIAHAEVEIIGKKYVDICDYTMEGTDVIEACNSYTWMDGITYTEDNNTATWVVTNVYGCDSIVHLDLTIHDLNTNVGQDAHVLTAELDGAIYQWVNCDDEFAPIDDATEQIYEATENGNYAVIVTTDLCSDTSDCFTVNSIGFEDFSIPEITVYPNPGNGAFVLNCEGFNEPFTVSVYNEAGQLIVSEIKYEVGGNYPLNITPIPGNYFVTVRSNGETYELTVIVQ